MNLLITGGTGTLGRQLLPALLKKPGLHPRLLSRRSAPPRPDIETATGDVTQPETLRPALENIDTVLHLAALTHSRHARDYFTVNTEGTRNLLNACEAAGVRRFFHMSSRAANQNGGAYSESKWQADAAVRDSSLEWTILKPAEVYGGGSNEGIAQLAGWIDRWPVLPIIGGGDYTMSPVHVEDVIAATVQAVTLPGLASETFVLGGPETMTFNHLADRLCSVRKKHPCKIHLPAAFMQGVVSVLSACGLGGMVPDQIPRLLCEKESDIANAREKLGYNPRSLEQGFPAR